MFSRDVDDNDFDLQNYGRSFVEKKNQTRSSRLALLANSGEIEADSENAEGKFWWDIFGSRGKT